MVQVLWFLTSMCEIWIEFQAPDFSSGPNLLLAIVGILGVNFWMGCFSLSLKCYLHPYIYTCFGEWGKLLFILV